MIIKSEQCFIYTLSKDGIVVYVGQSTNIISRVYQHQLDKSKEFDSVNIIECLKGDMDETEFAYICRFSPKLNKDVPVIPYSVRETAAKSYNKCISNNIVGDKGFNLENPDFYVELNGCKRGLWAKKGEEEEFLCQIDCITRMIKEIEDV